MKHFLLITNSFKDEGLTLTKKLKLYIKEKGGSALIFVSNGEEANKAAPKESEIPEETECSGIRWRWNPDPCRIGTGKEQIAANWDQPWNAWLSL